MRFVWTKEKIELYKRAAENTSFSLDLSNKIIKKLGEDRTIYDIGCGISYLSMYLSYFSNKIFCSDIDELVTRELKREIIKRNIKNIEVTQGDYKEILDNKKDVECIIASHFLDMNENLEYLLNKCKYLVIIKNTSKREGIYGYNKQKIEDVECILERKNIVYEKFIHNGDFGQPLKNINEAFDYYNSYSTNKKTKEEIKKLLIKNDNKEYPYYLPKDKNTGVIIVKEGMNE